MISIRRSIAFSIFVLACASQACSPAAGHHGHTHHHGFADAPEWAKTFEDPARDEWQKPDAVIASLELEADHRVADIGSATGYFPVRIARAVPAGRVWGVDIEPGMVRFLNERARHEGIANLFSVLGTTDDPLLPEPVDRVLLVDTYHHIGERTAYFAHLRHALRPGARLVIVDFQLGDFPVGPSDAMKLAPERVIDELGAAGFELVGRDGATLPYQYILTFAVRADSLEPGGQS